MGDPAGRFDTHRRCPDQSCEVRLEALELSGADLPLPLVSQFVEHGFAYSHDRERQPRQPNRMRRLRLPGIHLNGDGPSDQRRSLRERDRHLVDEAGQITESRRNKGWRSRGDVLSEKNSARSLDFKCLRCVLLGVWQLSPSRMFPGAAG